MTEQKIHYLTPDGLAKIAEEHRLLREVHIPEIAARIDDAKQQGDLSENAEYHQAKDDMAWAQGRLMELQFILDHAQVAEKAGRGVVSIGSSIVIKINGAVKNFTIVGPHEADPFSGKISNESPLGSAMIGAKEGDRIEIKTPGGMQMYEIIQIK